MAKVSEFEVTFEDEWSAFSRDWSKTKLTVLQKSEKKNAGIVGLGGLPPFNLMLGTSLKGQSTAPYRHAILQVLATAGQLHADPPQNIELERSIWDQLPGHSSQ